MNKKYKISKEIALESDTTTMTTTNRTEKLKMQKSKVYSESSKIAI